jgi:hypothetical protein
MRERVSKKGGWKVRAAFVVEGRQRSNEKGGVTGLGSAGQPVERLARVRGASTGGEGGLVNPLIERK